ncbi:hypothetical protein CO2235_U850041 [Cupriavidus oxalaticus]|uniref:Uncharacterized protein n=1 Tax=Cupriavidus oxalaticus TaxID=96344 RepID=A0A375FTK2_9BURK|nr:hypothetical protein CO2235_U850041 [Cupriavidus oxalaticus]
MCSSHTKKHEKKNLLRYAIFPTHHSDEPEERINSENEKDNDILPDT